MFIHILQRGKLRPKLGDGRLALQPLLCLCHLETEMGLGQDRTNANPTLPPLSG